MHRHQATRTFLDRMLENNSRKTADITEVVSAGNFGFLYEEVIREGECQETVLQGTANAGIGTRPGTTVPVLHSFGAAQGQVLASSPPGQGGVATTQGSESLFEVAPDEYYGLVADPTTSSLIHVHRYGLNGAFRGELTTINFAAQTDPTPNLPTAIPIKGVPGVPDGFAVLGSSGGDFFLMLANFASQAVTEVQLADATGNATSGTLQLDVVDPAGPFIYVGGVIDVAAAPDEVKLFRVTLPGPAFPLEVGLILKTGTGAVRFPGVYVPDRWRVPQQDGGAWTTIDSIFLDPGAVPQTVSETADINDNPDGIAAARIWPLGHNGVDTGWFAWEDDLGDDAGIRIWKVGKTGAGVEAGFTDGNLVDDFGPLFYNTGPVDNRWWTILGAKTKEQEFSTLYPRVVRIQFTGVGVTIPDPVPLDGAAAEADQGWNPGEGAPASVLAWFP